MTATLSELVRYRLTRAKETLGEAQTLAQSESWNGTINRLYYACFYAVSAYLLIVGKSSKTHASTKSAFHFNVVKTGLVTVEMGKIYNRLFENRFEGDYEDFVEFDSETVLPLLAQANDFINALNEITENALLQLPPETI